MAERGMLFGEGPTACPFVALESDRDRRADEPDHSHRCYAVPEPAPRALAHQRAYCLSSNFSGCPVFQDWAVRAAARPVHGQPASAAPAKDQPAAGPAWAAPPPWLGQDSLAGDEPEQIGAFDAPPQERPQTSPEERPGQPRPAEQPEPAPVAAIRGDRIERLPSLPLDATGDAERDARADAERRQRIEAAREQRAEEERRRQAEDERRERERRAAAAAAVPPFLAGRAEASKEIDAGRAAATAGAAHPPEPPHAPQAGSARAAPQQAHRPASEDWAAKRADLVPIWEREPIQAHPTLRRRVSFGDDALSRITTVFAVLAIIALAIFAIIAAPSFLGGGIAAPARPTAGPIGASPGLPVATAGTSPVATPAAEPTPRTYTVSEGDTLFGIAQMFGVTLDELLAANPEIVNANYVVIGQVVVIPEPGLPTAAPAATSSPAP